MIILLHDKQVPSPMRPIYYDTETTGLKSDKDRIIELAAYDPERKKSFVHLIDPACPIPSASTAVCHITDEMVAGKPSFKDLAESFIEFCEGDTVLIAHNNDNFDVHFLRAEFERAEVIMPEWKFLDTLKWARRYRPDLPRHSLQFLREVYGFEANNAHRALDDVMMMEKIFLSMIDDLSIDQVMSLMSQKRTIARMPFGKHQGKALDQIPKDYVSWLKSSGFFEKAGNSELKEAFDALGMLAATG